jgi:hypothetical protein
MGVGFLLFAHRRRFYDSRLTAHVPHINDQYI